MNYMEQILSGCPIIASVKDDSSLEQALQSECDVIFLLYGTILNITELVQRVKKTGKISMVHIDLIEGLRNQEIAVDGLVQLCHPDGLISTHALQIRRARQLGLLTIQRVFIFDSMSVNTLYAKLAMGHPDSLEILPGIMPRIIHEIADKITIPVIAGGLIKNKQEVIQAIQAGAISVSTSSQEVWNCL